MEKSDFDQQVRSEIQQYSNGRCESAAFLIWFLINFFRVDEELAVDTVCDQKEDKGIDGILVDDEEEVIYLFQSKFTENMNRTQGDNDIRNFIGASQWFKNRDNIDSLLEGRTSHHLKSLLIRLKILEKENYDIVCVFVTNRNFDAAANHYLTSISNIEGYDFKNLFNKYTYFADDEKVFDRKELKLSNLSKIEYNLNDKSNTTVKVYSIKAKELIKLEGIQDRTLFYKNVRYGLGNTRVNKSIKNTIFESSEHSKFFLYHNGITIVCENLEEDTHRNKIALTGYEVINGCQSMLTFFENQDALSDKLYVLVKIIKLNMQSSMVKKITKSANNQNSISLKDLKSNDSVQKTLQSEFDELFNGSILYRNKRGQAAKDGQIIIENDFAAQLIESIYFHSPHNTHLKQKLFGERYNKIFSRRINAEKIYLGFLIYQVVKENIALVDNEQIKKYGLALFFFAHVLSSILDNDEIGKEILENPKIFIIDRQDILKKSLVKVWQLIVPDINMDIDEYTKKADGFFDYKNLFKNKDFVSNMTKTIKANYMRLGVRNEEDKFAVIYNKNESEAL